MEGGWSTYTAATGRVIVGAGQEFHPKHQDWYMRLPSGGLERRLLEPYPAESSGGELEVALTVGEMPSHRHRTGFARTADGHGPGNYPDGVPSESGVSGLSAATGGRADGTTAPHPNMPPYIALYFCKKD